MKTYVRSRGADQHHGYRWHTRILETEHLLASEPEEYAGLALRRFTGSASCILARFHGALVLLLASVPSRRRVDFYPRRILQTVLWVSENGDEESGLQSACCAFLRCSEDAARRLDEAVDFDAELGFCVLYEAIAEMISGPLFQQFSIRRRSQIVVLTDRSACARADLLERLALPAREGVLVVMDRDARVSTLKGANVWLGAAGQPNVKDSFTRRMYRSLRRKIDNSWRSITSAIHQTQGGSYECSE